MQGNHSRDSRLCYSVRVDSIYKLSRRHHTGMHLSMASDSLGIIHATVPPHCNSSLCIPLVLEDDVSYAKKERPEGLVMRANLFSSFTLSGLSPTMAKKTSVK